MDAENDKYVLKYISMKDGTYTLTRNYDFAHVILGEIGYNGDAYAAKKNIFNLASTTAIDFTVPSIVLLGYAK